ncbi:type II toxin-antitoxin system PemK/MazF family toxin [Lacticaseibacillus paracasei]|uniref:type II toxin-antitoxin system PemK/MazF family toxin n=1 Tax=Lacticaseibacillus paracasei TaxID=1597 RepID=UPI0002FB2C87|nr:type II toxin-antitoxin system PemK/MazF family toxin [Lacticaseibacillus paracasei]
MIKSNFSVPLPGQIYKFDTTSSSKAGHEQMGYRPQLVISVESKNRITGVVTCLPITSSDHGYPSHIALPDGLTIKGFIETEHVNTYDLQFRQAKLVGDVPPEVLEQARRYVALSLGIA